MRILVAQNDVALGESLNQRLVQQQHAVEIVSNASEALHLAASQDFDIVILALSPRGTPGLDVLRTIRLKKPELPVLVVADGTTVEERVRALDAGADDYVAKPFAQVELDARIRAVLRRAKNSTNDTVLTVEDLTLDCISHVAKRRGHVIKLCPREFGLLQFLMQRAGHPVPETEIIENVWKSHCRSNVVPVYINYLRRKVDRGFDRILIRTLRGFGYQIGEKRSSQ